MLTMFKQNIFPHGFIGSSVRWRNEIYRHLQNLSPNRDLYVNVKMWRSQNKDYEDAVLFWKEAQESITAFTYNIFSVSYFKYCVIAEIAKRQHSLKKLIRECQQNENFDTGAKYQNLLKTGKWIINTLKTINSKSPFPNIVLHIESYIQGKTKDIRQDCFDLMLIILIYNEYMEFLNRNGVK